MGCKLVCGKMRYAWLPTVEGKFACEVGKLGIFKCYVAWLSIWKLAVAEDFCIKKGDAGFLRINIDLSNGC